MTEYKPIKEGKVREIYDVGENLILVATDRISCFDVILNNTVTKREQYLHRCPSSGSIIQRISLKTT